MKTRVIVASAVAIAFALWAAAAAPAAGSLHLKLDKSTPEADQVVEVAPQKLILDFSQAPELTVSRVAVSSAHGDAKLTEVKRSEEDETVLWVGFEESLADGTYTVNWMTSSGDGHPIRGEFSFTVRTTR